MRNGDETSTYKEAEADGLHGEPEDAPPIEGRSRASLSLPQLRELRPAVKNKTSASAAVLGNKLAVTYTRSPNTTSRAEKNASETS